MTTVKVKKKQKPNYRFSDDMKNQFRELNFEFVKYPGNKKGTYSSIERLMVFIQSEVTFWEELKNKPNLKNQSIAAIDQIISHFRGIYTEIIKFQNIDSSNSNFNNTIRKLREELSKLTKEKHPNIFSESQFAIILKQMVLKERNVQEVKGFFVGCLGSEVQSSISSNISNAYFFIGYNIGIRYRHPEHFKEVDDDFIKNTQSLLSNLNETYNNFNVEIEERSKLVEDELVFLSEKNKENIETNKQEIDELLSTKHTELDELVADKQKKLERMEDLYKNKLKLSEPADYWESTSAEYKQQGRRWTIGAAVTGLIFLVVLVFILVKTNLDKDWSLESVKFTIILTVIISIGFLLINLFIKLALSSFHLSNDATERYKLTYLYLALLNEDENNSVSSEERRIVFQSLFARSDSGLTKSDSGVQMPSAQQMLEVTKPKIN